MSGTFGGRVLVGGALLGKTCVVVPSVSVHTTQRLREISASFCALVSLL